MQLIIFVILLALSVEVAFAKLGIWMPKEKFYNPKKVDWSGVISGCQAACRYEKRFCNFYVRAAAHDSLSVSEGYGGADGTLLLTQDELKRSENNYDNFAFLLSKNALALARKYDSSVADIIAVCGAVATEFLGGPRIVKYDSVNPFLVGRHDSTMPNPANALAPADIDLEKFAKFAKDRKLTIEEMTALMGSHTVLDDKGCKRQDNTYCNPRESRCDDILMYSWSNIYYKETCTPNIIINTPPALSTLPLPTREFFVQENLCKFTNPEFRKRQEALLAEELADLPVLVLPDPGVLVDGELVAVPDPGLVAAVPDPNAPVVGQGLEFEDVTWYDDTTHIAQQWPYTIHDAWMGKACQRDVPMTRDNDLISRFMNRFKDDPSYWNKVYIRAYKKMVNTGAIWSKNGAYAISGLECRSGFDSTLPHVDCRKCKFQNDDRRYLYQCPKSCKCKSSFGDTETFYF